MFDRKRQLMWSKLKVGVVITVALVFLLLTVFFAGNIEDLFAPKVDVMAQIKDVRGLRRGAPVWVSGIEIGFVKDINLQPEGGTLVTMSIKRSALPYVQNDSSATVMTQGLLGDKYMELGNGSVESGPIKPGAVIKGRAQLEVKDLVEASSESLARVTEFVDKIGSFVEQFEKSQGTVAKLLKDPSLYNNLQDSSAALSGLLKEFHDSRGSLKMFMRDQSLYNNMLAASSSLEEFSRKMNEGNGTLRKLTESSELYDNLNHVSKKLDAVLSDIDSGEGTAGVLVKDKALAGELRETIAGLKETVTDLRELTKDMKAHPRKYFKFSVF